MSNGCPPTLFRYYGNVLAIAQAGPTSDGYLSAADWNRFNSGTGGGGGGGAVSTVFGRSGDVVAQIGDYTLNQIGPPTSDFVVVGSFRIRASGAFQLWNPDQAAWHTLQVRGAAGSEYITIGAADMTRAVARAVLPPSRNGHKAATPRSVVNSVFTRTGDVVAQANDYTLNLIGAPTANWTLPSWVRIKSTGAFQLWNPDEATWHTLQVRGSAGSEYMTIGAGET